MSKYINVADMIQNIVIKTIKEKGFVQVIRCKECKWYDGRGTCMNIGIAMLEPDWFCADGKRKE